MAKAKFRKSQAFKSLRKMTASMSRIIKPGFIEIVGVDESAGRDELVARLLKFTDRLDGLAREIEALEGAWPEPAKPAIARPSVPPIARPA